MNQSKIEWAAQAMAAGNLVWLQCPREMVNHCNRYGILSKKSPDGSRRIRYTANYKTLLEPDQRGRQPSDPVHLSRMSDLPPHSFCGFDHGFDQLDCGDEHSSKTITAKMSLAQLRRMAQTCAFCNVLVLGIYRYDWLWVPKLEKYTYCDAVFGNRHVLGKSQMMALLHAVDREGYYDDRFKPGNLTDSEVGLFIAVGDTFQVHIQKYPCPGMDGRMRSLETLEFYVRDGDWIPWSVITTRPSVVQHVLSAEGITKIKSWISDCEEHHKVCSSPTLLRENPTRLLMLTGDCEGSIRVNIVAPSRDSRPKYVALSHSWASSKPLKNVRSTHEAYQENIPWELMSQVYQDTCTLAFGLGYQYVWIDSLCIIQQDPEDWAFEAGRMGMVYSNAEVVFAAQGGHLGLVKDPPEMVEIAATMKDSGEELAKLPVFVRRVADHDNFVNSANDETTGNWFQRAWCFQERLFSPRILHFGGTLEDITFECNQELICECGGVDLLDLKRRRGSERQISSLWCHLKAVTAQQLQRIFEENPLTGLYALDHDSLAALKDELLVIYLALCEDFTAKSLTFPEDALPAMSSLALRIGPYFDNAYHAGLWEHQLVVALQWETFDCRKSRRIHEGCPPTFSWVSRTGGAIWYFTPAELLRDLDDCILAKVLQVRSDPLTDRLPYGKIGFSYISLKGNAVVCQIPQREADSVGRMLLELPGGEAFVQMDTQDDIDAILSPKHSIGISVLCFELMRNKPGTRRDASGEDSQFASTIILVPSKERDCFTRIGFAIVELPVFEVGASVMEVIVV